MDERHGSLVTSVSITHYMTVTNLYNCKHNRHECQCQSNKEDKAFHHSLFARVCEIWNGIVYGGYYKQPIDKRVASISKFECILFYFFSLCEFNIPHWSQINKNFRLEFRFSLIYHTYFLYKLCKFHCFFKQKSELGLNSDNVVVRSLAQG